MLTSIQRLNKSTAKPYSTDDLTLFLRVSGVVQQEYEAFRCAAAAAAEVEDYGQLALLNQTVRLTYDWLPQKLQHVLPIGPVLSNTGMTVTLGGDPFTDWELIPGNRAALYLTGYPNSELFRQRVIIQYQAGFGADASSIPPDLALVILDQAAMLFDGRSPADSRSPTLSPHLARVVARYRRITA